jgi:hypothetical protein
MQFITQNGSSSTLTPQERLYGRKKLAKNVRSKKEQNTDSSNLSNHFRIENLIFLVHLPFYIIK